ncbi:MAG: succinyl-diaminopimelate desuccinylase [Gaiellales bacterium]|nr:succinyl-diaminopimelate desuccinylase [Gaiellales bacterium]
MSSADELALAERLISYDTSNPEGIAGSMGFLKGWLEGQGIAHRQYDVNGLPAIVAAVGEGPATLIWNAHVDVVPGRQEQFSPWRVDGRLYGRGAYDMKGALAGMLAALADLSAARDSISGVKVKLLIVPDEESEEDSTRQKASSVLAEEGHVGEFVICGEPTDLEIGIQSKGVLVLRIDVEGRAAHGSTPWLGDNAVLKAIDLYQRIHELPFARGRSELYERPSVNIGRIQGGDVVNKVPDHCRIDVDIRYLPNQDPHEVLRQVRGLGAEVTPIYELPPATLDPGDPHVRALSETVREVKGTAALAVGRDGASDAVFFLERGIPAVEFGPTGAGHHGPEEYVEIESLARYRRILAEFARGIARRGRERIESPARRAG